MEGHRLGYPPCEFSCHNILPPEILAIGSAKWTYVHGQALSTPCS
jgi:hypothetical protein